MRKLVSYFSDGRLGRMRLQPPNITFVAETESKLYYHKIIYHFWLL